MGDAYTFGLAVQIPNVLGFVFGLLQMVLYAIYRNYKAVVVEEVKLPEHTIDVGAVTTSEAEEISSSEPEIHDDHHQMIGMSCNLQNQCHDHDLREPKILELPNSNQMLGTCQA